MKTHDKSSKIASIELHESAIVSKLPHIENERNTAVKDLLENNLFQLKDEFKGPYDLHLSVRENRLVIMVFANRLLKKQKNSKEILVSLKPLKKIIKDYFLVCESYFEAVKSANAKSVEAIDMGRRSVHNEGATMLSEVLESKIEIDFDTARRLFTLICVLHIR